MKWPWLHRYSIIVAVCTLPLLITGTFVTENEQRPLFSVGATHPIAGALVGILMIGLVVWLSLVEMRSWMRWLSWAALGVMVIECLLGLIEPPRRVAISFFHTFLAYIFFAATTAIVVFTSKSWAGPMKVMEADCKRPSLRSLSMFGSAVVLAQILIGTGFRYGGLDIVTHILGAMIVVVLCLMVGIRAKEQSSENRAVRISAVVMMGAALLQVLLGVTVLSIQAINPEDPLPVMLGISAHVAVAALTLAAILALTIQIQRYVRSTPPKPSGQESSAISAIS